MAESAAGLLGTEGVAARLYFEAFPTLMPRAGELPGPAYTGLRNRRPPTDAVNCLLSFCYGLLTKELMAACLAVGFDPYIGLYRRPRFGRPALVLDLAEEFRPLLADSVALTLVNNGEVGRSDFVVRAGAVTLTSDGRKAVNPRLGTANVDQSAASALWILGELPARGGAAGAHPGGPA